MVRFILTHYFNPVIIYLFVFYICLPFSVSFQYINKTLRSLSVKCSRYDTESTGQQSLHDKKNNLQDSEDLNSLWEEANQKSAATFHLHASKCDIYHKFHSEHELHMAGNM